MKVKELIELLEKCDENLVVKAPIDEVYLGEVISIIYRSDCYELVVEDK